MSGLIEDVHLTRHYKIFNTNKYTWRFCQVSNTSKCAFQWFGFVFGILRDRYLCSLPTLKQTTEWRILSLLLHFTGSVKHICSTSLIPLHKLVLSPCTATDLKLKNNNKICKLLFYIIDSVWCNKSLFWQPYVDKIDIASYSAIRVEFTCHCFWTGSFDLKCSISCLSVMHLWAESNFTLTRLLAMTNNNMLTLRNNWIWNILNNIIHMQITCFKNY